MNQAATYVENVKKIAVLRANALGDFIFGLPALEAIRTTYPDAEIVYLGRQWHNDFMQGRPSVIDRLVVIPRYGGVGEEPTFEADAAQQQLTDQFFTRMRQEKFDIAIQLHGGGRYSNPLTARLGARLSVGLQAADAPPLDRNTPFIFRHHEIMRYLEVVSLIGCRPVTIRPHLSVTAADKAEALKAVAQLKRPFIVVHGGASVVQRRWPPDRYAATATALSRDGYDIVLTGGPDEARICAAIEDEAPGKVLNLCGKLSLSGLTGLISLARLVITNDTGPLHIADAVDTPTVSVFWGPYLLFAAPTTRLHHRQVPGWIIYCPLCGTNCAEDYYFTQRLDVCRHQVSFLTDIPPSAVIDTARDLLDATAA